MFKNHLNFKLKVWIELLEDLKKMVADLTWTVNRTPIQNLYYIIDLHLKLSPASTKTIQIDKRFLWTNIVHKTLSFPFLISVFLVPTCHMWSYHILSLNFSQLPFCFPYCSHICHIFPSRSHIPMLCFTSTCFPLSLQTFASTKPHSSSCPNSALTSSAL